MIKKNLYRKLTLSILTSFILSAVISLNSCQEEINPKDQAIEHRIDELLAQMTVEEKIGQLCQLSLGAPENLTPEIIEKIKKGEVGSFLNCGFGDFETKQKVQKIAVEESRLGIPLIFARDVIHGYRTLFPIPLGQAASWNTKLVKEAARVSAREAAANGIHWTFAPMIDIARDPRWGRIAESCGEDPLLAERFAEAMVSGFQGDSLNDPHSIAACAKHYVGYGAAEGGRDYNTTLIPETELRNVYLRSFKVAQEAGVATFMSAFNDLNGVPTSGNKFTLKTILRDEWGFDGFVVSDWKSVEEMIYHGYCADEKEAAYRGFDGGVDMEMVSETYTKHLKSLIDEGRISMTQLDDAVRHILRIKFRLGLFDKPYSEKPSPDAFLNKEHLAVAKELSKQSIVLLKNDSNTLPLSKDINKLAIIGPMANNQDDQRGTWSLDGLAEDVQTPLVAIQDHLGKDKVVFAKGLKDMMSPDAEGIAEAVAVAASADVIVAFIGEASIMSGEAHCRAFLDLPGDQKSLVSALKAVGKPLVLVFMTGRPMTFEQEAQKADAILYAWHPGTMGGPAIADILFGEDVPSGKLPCTFPRTVGQIPTYYNHRNTGRPPTEDNLGIPAGTPVKPTNYTSNYIDINYTPAYYFGYGLSYTSFAYSQLEITPQKPGKNDTLTISAQVKNTGQYKATEVVQLYIQDVAASLTRPVKELKGFERVEIKPGESVIISFQLTAADLGFYNSENQFVTEAGLFNVWLGGSSIGDLEGKFELVE